MTFELIVPVVIVVVGLSATLFLLSCSWWLWRHAPPTESARPAPSPPRPTPPARSLPATKPASEQPQKNSMGWAQPGVPSAPAPSSPARAAFEAAKLEPADPGAAKGEGGEIDGARTMFFVKKKISPDRTEILTDEFDFGRDPDAPVALDQQQTAPTRSAQKPKPKGPVPPPPPRR